MIQEVLLKRTDLLLNAIGPLCRHPMEYTNHRAARLRICAISERDAHLYM